MEEVVYVYTQAVPLTFLISRAKYIIVIILLIKIESLFNRRPAPSASYKQLSFMAAVDLSQSEEASSSPPALCDLPPAYSPPLPSVPMLTNNLPSPQPFQHTPLCTLIHADPVSPHASILPSFILH